MSDNIENTSMAKDEALERLLSQAPRRPVPSTADEAKARAAVQSEWRNVVHRQSRRRNVVRFALAATVLVAAFLSFNVFRTNGIAPVQVATIDKSFGSIYLLGERSELHETSNLESVVAGQSVKTGPDSGLGVVMGTGPSLRVDEQTRIEFMDDGTVHLYTGRVYVDSNEGSIIIVTDQGVVTHRGTQYMTAIDGTELSVSVRAGEVAIDGAFHDTTVTPGQLVTMRGSQRPRVANIAVYGNAWNWAAEMAPSKDFDGKTVLQFLDWVSHETGLDFEFETPRAEKLASGTLSGKLDLPPMRALTLRMKSADLDWRIEDGVIYIRETGTQ